MKNLGAKIIIAAVLLAMCSVIPGAFAGGRHINDLKVTKYPASGIVGITVWSNANAEPVQCFVDVKTPSGKRITTVESSKDGVFTVQLQPGTYVLTSYYVPSGNPRPNFVIAGSSLTVTVKNALTAVELPLSF
jgi:hypothetical protein